MSSVEEAHVDALKMLHALRLELPHAVWVDVDRKVRAVLAERAEAERNVDLLRGGYEVALSDAEALKADLRKAEEALQLQRVLPRHVCSTCEQPLTEVRVKVTGICPTHGITAPICGNPGCWCVALSPNGGTP